MCNTGTHNRTRECNNPLPTRGGYDCFGDQYEQASCADQCPGQWATWNMWSDCTSTCDEGTQIRVRHCIFSDNITIANNCPGESIDTAICRNVPCPGPGVWTEWTQWSACSTSCGSGFRYIARFCINPNTEKEKHDCVGHAVESQSCQVKQCPVDGSWSEWTGWNGCSRGLHSRSRECNNPAPLYNGTDCQGTHVDVATCTEATTIATTKPHVLLIPPEIFGSTEANVGGNVTLLCLTDMPGLILTWYYQENSRTLWHTLFLFFLTGSPVILSLIKTPGMVVEGAAVNIKCNVLGFPEPVVRWGYKDRSGNPFIPPPVSYKEGGTEIDIDSFQSMLYGGTWTCNAINKLGSDHRDITL
ncbi:hypothetical protein ACJMK2_026454 [Sinanodonta woodiana]|uniref:Ig-like domain-containing protein n=1 Tax=Sinanodonta woodiana TaxID=1069815 RepID=A0ABD3XJP6_SINWO